MSDQGRPALEVMQGQMKELDELFKQASEDLNTVAASERVAKWKLRTIAVVAEHRSREDVKRFAETQAGPSITNDVLEELSDDIEVYRNGWGPSAAKRKKQQEANPSQPWPTQ